MNYISDRDWRCISKNFDGKLLLFLFNSGVSNNSIFFLLEECSELITSIGRKCRLNQICISTAHVFFHKMLFNERTFESEFAKAISCAASVLIASKATNQLVSVQLLCKSLVELLAKQTNYSQLSGISLFDLSESVTAREMEILVNLNFEVDIELPYLYIHQMKEYFFNKLENLQLMTITANFVNDTLKLPLCLFYRPIDIAFACIYLMKLYLKITLPKYNTDTDWYQVISDSVSMEVIYEIATFMNNMYKVLINKSGLTTSTPMLIIFDGQGNNIQNSNVTAFPEGEFESNTLKYAKKYKMNGSRTTQKST